MTERGEISEGDKHLKIWEDLGRSGKICEDPRLVPLVQRHAAVHGSLHVSSAEVGGDGGLAEADAGELVAQVLNGRTRTRRSVEEVNRTGELIEEVNRGQQSYRSIEQDNRTEQSNRTIEEDNRTGR